MTMSVILNSRAGELLQYFRAKDIIHNVKIMFNQRNKY